MSRLAPAGLAAALAVAAFLPSFSRGAFTFETFRRRGSWVHADVGQFRERAAKRSSELIFDEDGAAATVAVLDVGGGNRVLFVNGKADASTQGDVGIQSLLGHVPLLLAPDAKDVFLVGLGSGMTAGAILRHPVERLDVVEISPEVVRASRLFDRFTGAPLDDPRTTLIEDDARIALALAPRKYDVIVSQPSNPWIAGIGSLFTVEHFRAIADHLKPGGIAVQWFQLYECSDDLVDLVLRTFRSVFPHVRIFTDRMKTDILLVGALEPRAVDLAALEARFRYPPVRDDMKRLGIGEVSTFLLLELFGPEEARLLGGGGPLHRDDLPVLEHEAPRALFVGDRALRLIRLADDPARVVPPGDRLLERQLAGRAPIAAEIEDAIAHLSGGLGRERWTELPGLLEAAARTFPEPARTEAVRHRAHEALRGDAPEQAIALLEPLAASGAATAADLAVLAERLMLREDRARSRLVPAGYERALAAALELGRRFPEAAAAGRYAEGMIRLRRGERAEAEGLLRLVADDAAAAPGLRGEAALALARLAYARGEIDLARARARQAAEIQPERDDARQLFAALAERR